MAKKSNRLPKNTTIYVSGLRAELLKNSTSTATKPISPNSPKTLGERKKDFIRSKGTVIRFEGKWYELVNGEWQPLKVDL